MRQNEKLSHSAVKTKASANAQGALELGGSLELAQVRAGGLSLCVSTSARHWLLAMWKRGWQTQARHFQGNLPGGTQL